MRNQRKFAMGLSLTILFVLSGTQLAYAQSVVGAPNAPLGNKGDSIQTQNHRQKTPHSARKAAAVRLKKKHQSDRAERMAKDVREHSSRKGG